MPANNVSRRRHFDTIVVAIGITLGGCVAHTWAPGPGASLPYGQASGQCQLLSMGVDQPVSAAFAGSPKLVGLGLGTSMLAGAIGNAVRENQAFNACMQAAGYVPVDAAPGAVRQ